MERREYSVLDIEVLSKAKLLFSMAEEHLDALTAFDSSLDSDFMDEWAQAIQTVEDMPTDEVTVDQQQQLTDMVDQRHKACIEAVGTLRYYAGKAFDKSSEEMALFNFKGLARARGSVPRLVVYVKVLHRAALQYTAALEAKGMSPAQRDALLSAANALLQADEDQEFHKHYRLMLTRRRTAVHNMLWGLCKQVHLAAGTVFRDDYVRLRQFSLDTSS